MFTTELTVSDQDQPGQAVPDLLLLNLRRVDKSLTSLLFRKLMSNHFLSDHFMLVFVKCVFCHCGFIADFVIVAKILIKMLVELDETWKS